MFVNIIHIMYINKDNSETQFSSPQFSTSILLNSFEVYVKFNMVVWRWKSLCDMIIFNMLTTCLSIFRFLQQITKKIKLMPVCTCWEYFVLKKIKHKTSICHYSIMILVSCLFLVFIVAKINKVNFDIMFKNLLSIKSTKSYKWIYTFKVIFIIAFI